MLIHGKNDDMRTVYDLLDEHRHFLDANQPEHSNSFHHRCNNQPEAARAEAVVFSFFQWNGYDIRVEETGSEGGVDFRVQTENTDLVVEVTSILRETFTEHSGIPERIISGKGYSIDPYKVPHLIRSEVSSKAKQMSGYDCPRILVITCEHPEYADFLFDKDAFGPAMLLTSPPKLEIPGGTNITCLEDSLFFRFQNDRIVFCRESISAVLLFYIHTRIRSEIVGLLHPKPVHDFSIKLLPSVPFVEAIIPKKILVSEMKDYSVEDFDNQISTRWIPNNLPDGLFRYN